jgi:hypothetical protein
MMHRTFLPEVRHMSDDTYPKVTWTRNQPLFTARCAWCRNLLHAPEDFDAQAEPGGPTDYAIVVRNADANAALERADARFARGEWDDIQAAINLTHQLRVVAKSRAAQSPTAQRQALYRAAEAAEFRERVTPRAIRANPTLPSNVGIPVEEWRSQYRREAEQRREPNPFSEDNGDGSGR